MKKRVLTIAVLLLLFLMLMPAYGAETFEIDISKLSGAKKGDATTHSGRPTVVPLGYLADEYVAEFNQNTKKSLQNAFAEAKKTLNISAINVVYKDDGTTVESASIDLTEYESIEITYGTKEGFIAQSDDLCAALLFISTSYNVGFIPSPINDSGLIVAGNLSDAEITNPDAEGIKSTERKVTLDVSSLTYNGPMILSVYNVGTADLDSVVVSKVKFIAKEVPNTEPTSEPTSEPETTNPQTGDISLLTYELVSLSAVFLKKKKISK